MQLHGSHAIRATLLAAVALLGAPQLASAVNVSAYVSTIQQWGTGSAFYLGHTVIGIRPSTTISAPAAPTRRNAIIPATLPVTGERHSVQPTGFDGPTSLIVTIPAQQPAIAKSSRDGSRFRRNTHLSCNYRWTAFATESGYTIGAGGISFQVGNGTARDGGTVDFTMYRRTRPDAAGGGCTP